MKRSWSDAALGDDDDGGGAMQGVGDVDLDGLDLDALAHDDGALGAALEKVPEMDPAQMKRTVLAFERALTRNQQMRVKYANDPTKFVDSEVELDEEARKLLAVAAHPELLAEFAALGAGESVLALLTHDNADIALDAIAFLKDCTDVDDAASSDPAALAGVEALLEALLKAQLLPLLVATLGRLDEAQQEEKQGVHSVLGIVENLLDLRLELADDLATKTPLLAWLVKRLQLKEFDDVKLYASEILAILVQNAEAAVQKLVPLQAVDVLLTAVARYKKTDPASTDEEEYVENLFDVLCVVAVDKEHRRAFAQAEGLKLVQIVMKNKVFARKGALKLLDYVLQGDVKSCRRWVQLPALGTLFAALMKSGSRAHKKAFDARQDAEHCVSAVWSLLRLLSHDAKDFELRERVLDKFREEDMRKIERLCELEAQYRALVRDAVSAEDEEDEGDDSEAEARLLERLDAGLFVLQLVCLVLAELATSDAAMSARIAQLLTLNDSSAQQLAKVVRGFARTLGDEAEDAAAEKQHVQELAEKLLAMQ